MRFTIVVPVRNTSAHLERYIAALLAQAMMRRLAEEAGSFARPLEILMCHGGEAPEDASITGCGLPRAWRERFLARRQNLTVAVSTALMPGAGTARASGLTGYVSSRRLRSVRLRSRALVMVTPPITSSSV
jgi:hypothetical protein